MNVIDQISPDDEPIDEPIVKVNQLYLQKHGYLKQNVKTLVFYMLSLSVALQFRGLIKTVINGFSMNKLINQATYVVLLFGLIIFTAYISGNISV
jgi:hypothetical protein